MNRPDLQEILAAIIADSSDQHAFDNAGIEIYRRNRTAGAVRALSVSYPTVALMIGEPLLTLFARQFLADTGKGEVDWGAWGDEFPVWLRRHPISAEHPYLADTARVDRAVHVSNRARDREPDPESIQLIEQHDLNQLRVVFTPGTFVVSSSYPVFDIVHAHRENPSDPDLTAARAKLDEGIGQTVIIWRDRCFARIREALPGEAPWLRLIADSSPLAGALLSLQPGDIALHEWLSSGFETQLIEKLTIEDAEV